MKIATYNVWNDSKSINRRFKQLIEEINTVDADIIGLQEVTTYFYEEVLRKETSYQYHFYSKYPEEEEGLAVLSKYPIRNSFSFYNENELENSRAIKIVFEVDGLKFSFTNVHLPWDSVRLQEKQMIAIDRYLHSQQADVDFFILLGDFNGGLDSSVDRYLSGNQTLYGVEANPYWNEISSAYAARSGQPVKPTLDIVNNPRWRGKKTIYTPEVVDRIYIMDHWYTTSLESFHVFGTDISPENQLSASDHYGVVADISFSK